MGGAIQRMVVSWVAAQFKCWWLPQLGGTRIYPTQCGHDRTGELECMTRLILDCFQKCPYVNWFVCAFVFVSASVFCILCFGV